MSQDTPNRARSIGLEVFQYQTPYTVQSEKTTLSLEHIVKLLEVVLSTAYFVYRGIF